MTNTQTTTTSPATTVQQQPSLLGSLTPILLMVLVFYFLIMRPQQKREAKRRNLVNSVKRGDRVLLSSGIIGILHKIIGEKEVSLEVSENVRIRVLKNSIAEILEKGSDLENEDTAPVSSTASKSAPKKSPKK
ncbi:MAG: preprotein translocase subunit YajC [Holosporaceae bacterium]|nr:preprotein translocase subunit YajC [Holosporaceae bacterium]